MVKKDLIVVDGTVIEVLPATMFRVKIDNTEHIVLAHLSGKMRLNYIIPNVGDRVRIEMSPHDLTKGRIVYRYSKKGTGTIGERNESA